MKKGKIKFEEILGNKGKKYDNWLEKQIEEYYLTYKQNLYSDEFDFSIERRECGASEPVFIAKTIDEIVKKIDKRMEEIERRKSKNMKNYEKVIDKRNSMQNAFALNVLLQCGRNNLLDDKYYENMIKEANGTSLMSADYQKQVYEIARNMAKLDDKGICEYVYDKVKADKKLEKGR